MAAKSQASDLRLQKEGHAVRNGIIVTVGGGLILGGLNYWIPSLWSLTKGAAAWVWGVANYTIGMPVWGLALIAVFVVPTLVQIWNALRRPKWCDYVEDQFHGMRFRWSWQFRGVQGLRCYCPQDDTALVFSEDRDRWNVVVAVSWHCETCRRKFGPFEGGGLRYFNASIERQIDRKVRNDEWRKTDNS